MLFRNYLALDISQEGLSAVSLRRRGRGIALMGGRNLRFGEGVFSASAKEPNVLERERFRAFVTEVLDPLSGQEERVALSIPDGAGRLLLLDLDTPIKSKREGVEVIKWQAKETLPGDPSAFHLDYQVLQKDESGRSRVLAAFVAKDILRQYEDLLAEAGYHVSLIDFHSLGVYNFYHSRIDLGENFTLVGVEGERLFFQYFEGKTLTFHRAKGIEKDSKSLFQELSRTVVSCRETFPAFRRAAVFLHADRDDAQEILRSCFEREIIPLEPHLKRISTHPLTLSSAGEKGLVAALGMAERLM